MFDGLNWSSQEDGSPLVLAYFQKRIRGEEGRAKRGDHEDSGQEPPPRSTLHLQVIGAGEIPALRITT